MAEQDNFLRGASLGMNAAQAGIQAQQFNQNLQFRKSESDRQAAQFKTNLAEKARQFNQSYDLDKAATDASVARDSLAIKNTAFQLEQQTLTANLINEELGVLADFKDRATEAYNNNQIEMPTIPSPLTGERMVEAQKFVMSLQNNRKDTIRFQNAQRDQQDIEVLINQYGLPSYWRDVGELWEAAKNPANQEAQLQLNAMLNQTSLTGGQDLERELKKANLAKSEADISALLKANNLTREDLGANYSPVAYIDEQSGKLLKGKFEGLVADLSQDDKQKVADRKAGMEQVESFYNLLAKFQEDGEINQSVANRLRLEMSQGQLIDIKSMLENWRSSQEK